MKNDKYLDYPSGISLHNIEEPVSDPIQNYHALKNAHKVELSIDMEKAKDAVKDIRQKVIPKMHTRHNPHQINYYQSLAKASDEYNASNTLPFNVNSFIDRLEDMKPNDYIFNKPQIEQNFGELILNTNKKEWDFVLFSRVLESIYGIMKWREYQLHHIVFDDTYLSNYKIADPDCYIDRHRFAATYCGALDDLKAKADSMIYSVIEYYLPMFDDIKDDEE